MENEEMNLTVTCETDQDVTQEETEESIPSVEVESNSADQNENDDAEAESLGENSALALAPSVSSQTIKVYLRLKPLPSKTDLTREQENAYTIANTTTLLAKFPGLDVNTRSLKNLKVSERVCRTFTFTAAFGPEISQTEFFDEAIKSQIRNFLNGQNSTVMSYGTSNAGKSYTLYGVPSALGIIPLSMEFIFCKVKSTLSTPWYKPIHQSDVIGLSSSDRLREMETRDKLLSFTSPEKTEFINAYQAMRETMREEELAEDLTSRQDENVIYSVWISFAEIYNDAIYDLLSSDWHKKRLPLKMVTDKHGRTFIKDLRTVYVNSDEEAYQILLAGQYRSQVAATTLNPRSSRSHCIFTVKLLKYYSSSAPEDVEVSALSFCDLAGSGRLKMTTNIRDRLKETQNINTSLLVLGRCLKSIWEGQSMRQKSEVIGPFRESKLTRLFQKALCGKERMTLIVNVNPVPSLYAETQNVLNFSAIAKKIIVEPVKDVKKKMFSSRFSRVVSQSVKTVTDWDHAAVEESTNEIYHEKVNTSDYIPRECYDDLSTEYEKLKMEHVALKASMIDKDLEIREEMASTYTGLINNLEASWRSRSRDAEEEQENLLNWSVSQVENFYKEKLSRLNSRKRRRWDDGDAVDDREADIREMEAENASLTSKILVTKKTIKELRSGRENAIAEKNKAVFELSLVKEEIIGLKKMLAAAENDIRCEEDGAHFIHELKKQLNNRQERIKNLKEFLNEAKEEYISITSDAGRMQEELKEANETLIENAEKIGDLEEQLYQSNIFVAQQTKEIEQLTEKLELQSKQITEFEARAKNAEEELRKSEAIRLNLIGAVEDLNKLNKVSCTPTPDNFDYLKNSLTGFEANIGHEEHVTHLENAKSVSEITNVESENSPVRQEFRTENRSENTGNLLASLNRLDGKGIKILDMDSIFDTDESVYKENENSYGKLSVSSEINDSGIAVTISSQNQTMEKINLTVDTDFEIEDKNSRLESAEFTTGMDKQRFNSEGSNENFVEVNVPMKTEAKKYVDEHEVKIGKLEKDILELKAQYVLESQLRQERINTFLKEDIHMLNLSQLEQKVTEFEIALAKCQNQGNEQNKQLLNSLERLSLLEIQSQNWQIRELENTEKISCSCKKSENDSQTNLSEDGTQPYDADSDLRQSENLENVEEPSPKVNIQSIEELSEDFKAYHTSKGDSGDEKFGNCILSSENQQLDVTHLHQTKDTSWDDETSSNAIELLTAPTSTPRGTTSFHVKPILTASPRRGSISLRNSVVQVGEKSAMTKKKDGTSLRSQPLEIWNVSKRRNVRVAPRSTKRSENLNDSIRGSVSSALNHPTTFLPDKSVASSLMGSRWASRKTKPLIRKNEDYVQSEPKQEPVIRNRKPR